MKFFTVCLFLCLLVIVTATSDGKDKASAAGHVNQLGDAADAKVARLHMVEASTSSSSSSSSSGSSSGSSSDSSNSVTSIFSSSEVPNIVGILKDVIMKGLHILTFIFKEHGTVILIVSGFVLVAFVIFPSVGRFVVTLARATLNFILTLFLFATPKTESWI